MKTFTISDKEEKEAKDWISAQINNHPRVSVGPIGGRFSYMITPTGIGNFIQVMDNQTGEEQDVTDIDKI